MAKKPLTDNNIVDVEITEIRKKNFRFDGDDNRVVSLNLADLSIMSRVSEVYAKLQELVSAAQELTIGLSGGDSTDEVMADYSIFGEKLKEIDTTMRGYIDYIFGTEVSQAASPDGTMYDIFNGQFRFEYILTTLLQYYGENINNEFNNIMKHASDYIKDE